MIVNNKYNIELSVLTPLSIGAGAESEWVKGADYVIKDNKVYIIDLKKAIACGANIDKLTELFIKGDDYGIIKILGNKLEQSSKVIFDSPAQTGNNIKTFIRSQLVNKPIVPGSSLKGPLRSILFAHLRDNEEKLDDVLGTMKIGDILTRFVKVSDFEQNQTELVNTKIFNLRLTEDGWAGGWKHADKRTTADFSPLGFNTLYECIMPGEKAIGNISLCPDLFSAVDKKMANEYKFLKKSTEKKNLLSSDIYYLFSIINQHTKNYLTKERAFFETYNTDCTANIIDSIDRLLNMIPSDNSYCILKMSAGVGFHAITGDYQFDDYTDGKLGRKGVKGPELKESKPKSRKIAIHDGKFSIMGFVKLSSIDQDSYSEKLEDLLGSRESILRTRLDAIHLVKQQEEEKLAKEKELTDKYEALINEASALIEAKEFDKAIAKLEDARVLIPSRDKIKAKIEDCKNAKQDYEAKQKEVNANALIAEMDKDKEARNQLPLSERIANISSAGNLAGTIKKWLATYGNSFGDAELQTLVDFVANHPNKKFGKDILKKKGDFIKVIGDDYAKTLFDSIK